MSVSNPDELKRRAEIDRLMSLANVHRLRGEFIPGEDKCREILELDPENLPARELLADFLYARGKLDEAAEIYKEILEKHPKRVSVEDKYARTVLEIGEREHMKMIAQDMIENPGKYAQPERNSVVAILLSVVAPGFGHIYFGDYIKGFILLGIFILSWVIVVFTPGTQLFAQQVGEHLRRPEYPIMTSVLNPLAILFAGIGVFTYIYAVIDASVIAGKSGVAGKQ